MNLTLDQLIARLEVLRIQHGGEIGTWVRNGDPFGPTITVERMIEFGPGGRVTDGEYIVILS